MDREEARQTLSTWQGHFVKVWATALPEHKDFMEYRFPGLSYTGYILAVPLDVLAMLDWIHVSKIEEW